MTLPIIILIVSLVFLYFGIQAIIGLFIKVICFWGKVAWRSPDKIDYLFYSGGTGLALFVLGIAGTLWSVIVLAMRYVVV